MELFLQHCQAALQNHGGLATTLLIGGFVGSLTHCVGMCGPFAFAQTTASKAATRAPAGGNILTRVKGAALMPYHLGRITTYTALGVAAATFSGFFADSAVFRTVAVAMMVLAGTLFLGSAVPGLRTSLLPNSFNRMVLGLGTKLGDVARPFVAGQTPLHRYALGVTLGFLPCGLVGAALLAVAATGDPAAAFFSMAGFGLATIPALTLVAAAGQLSANRWPSGIKTIARGAMVLSGASLFAIAGGLLS